MSQESVERIIGKVVLDAGFRDALLADPDQLLADFNLTDAERISLKRMDAETLDHLATILSGRVRQWQVKDIFIINQEEEKAL
ncbi:MAG: Franean1_4349 family RiPP [Anaerolineae bacterium]|nr:Franean1_4349 family RiPP [Anaerolineae bacterium]